MPEQPDFLFVMTDQHRVDTLGCYGNEEPLTPRLDALAAGGTRFTDFFTPCAVCTPARASLLTGKAPFRHGLVSNVERNVGYHEDLPAEEFAFSTALRERGYQVGLVGKWHVGATREPSSFGFDGTHFPGAMNPTDHPEYLDYLRANGLPGVTLRDEVRGTLSGGRQGHLLAARLDQPVEATFEYFLASRAIEQLRRYAGEPRRPFFLALHFFGPHLPYLLPDEYADLVDPARVTLPASFAETFEGKPPVQRNYSRYWSVDTLSEQTWRQLVASYWGYVRLVDDQVGRVLDELDRLGLAETCTTFFTADHGEFTGAHRMHDKGPGMYEDIYRIPAIAHGPEIAAGRVDDSFATLTDLTATVLELAGCDPSPAVDGRSLVPLLRGETVDGWRDHVFAEFHGHHFAHPQRMVRDRRYKLVVNPESFDELYDLATDPDELHNRFADPALAEVRERMLRTLYRELVDRGDRFHHWLGAVHDIREVPGVESGRGGNR